MTQTKYNIVLPVTLKFYSGHNIRVLLSVDYEFLSALYVLSGASGMLKAFLS